MHTLQHVKLTLSPPNFPAPNQRPEVGLEFYPKSLRYMYVTSPIKNNSVPIGNHLEVEDDGHCFRVNGLGLVCPYIWSGDTCTCIAIYQTT